MPRVSRKLINEKERKKKELINLDIQEKGR